MAIQVFLGKSQILTTFQLRLPIDESLLASTLLEDGSVVKFKPSDDIAQLTSDLLANNIQLDKVVSLSAAKQQIASQNSIIDFSSFSKLSSFSFSPDSNIDLEGCYVSMPTVQKLSVPMAVHIGDYTEWNLPNAVAVKIEGLTYNDYLSQKAASGSKFNGIPETALKFDAEPVTKLYFQDGSVDSYDVSGQLAVDDIQPSISRSSASNKIERFSIGSNVTDLEEDFGYILPRSFKRQLTAIQLSPSQKTTGEWNSLCNLQVFDIPDGVQEVDIGTIQSYGQHVSLSSIYIPDSVISISFEAFNGLSSLKKAVVGSGCQQIDSCAFMRCIQLSSIAFDNTALESVGPSCFLGTSISEVKLPDSVTSIGSYAYDIREELTSITLPSSLVEICDNAFFSCNMSTELSIPDSCLSIGESAFDRSHSLPAIDFGNGLKHIGDAAFTETYSLSGKRLVFPASLEHIGRSAFRMTHARDVDLSKTKLVALEDFVFNNSSVSSIQLPSTLLSIGNRALANWHLSTISIPSSTVYIDQYAFSNGASDVEERLSVHFIGRSREEVQSLPGYPWFLDESKMTFN